MSRKLTLARARSMGATRFTLLRNSAMPNRPRARATISTPSYSSTTPKAKRVVPVLTSVPTRPRSRPSTVMATPFSAEPRARVEPASSPSSIKEQISAGPNLKATSTRAGAKKIISMMPNEAPTKLEIIVIPSAVPPFPARVMG